MEGPSGQIDSGGEEHLSTAHECRTMIENLGSSKSSALPRFASPLGSRVEVSTIHEEMHLCKTNQNQADNGDPGVGG